MDARGSQDRPRRSPSAWRRSCVHRLRAHRLIWLHSSSRCYFIRTSQEHCDACGPAARVGFVVAWFVSGVVQFGSE
jgi:hypothetical protein